MITQIKILGRFQLYFCVWRFFSTPSFVRCRRKREKGHKTLFPLARLRKISTSGKKVFFPHVQGAKKVCKKEPGAVFTYFLRETGGIKFYFSLVFSPCALLLTLDKNLNDFLSPPFLFLRGNIVFPLFLFPP